MYIIQLTTSLKLMNKLIIKTYKKYKIDLYDQFSSKFSFRINQCALTIIINILFKKF